MPGWGDDFETGLVDNFNATIVQSSFTTDARYGGGELLVLKWELEGTDQDGQAVEETILYPVAKGWESTDGGKTVHHESGNENKYFNKNSTIAIIINRCIKDFGMRDLLERRGGPLESKVWEGLTFRFKREETNYGGDIGVKSRLMPVEFLGEGADTKKAAGGGASAAASAGASDKALKAKLTALAKKSDTHADFMEAALAMDGVTDNEELLNAVVDEDNGIYAEANA